MYTKIVQAGTMVEVYQYERHPNPPRSSSRSKRNRQWSRVKKSVSNLQKARQSFIRLVRANLTGTVPCMLTLTMVDVVSLSRSIKYFTRFFVLLRSRYGAGIRYIGVPEFQKRGAVHFHVLVWGLPNDVIDNERHSRAIQVKWRRGYVDIIRTDGSEKLSGYLAKYMLKAVRDNRLVGKRAYLRSRNLVPWVSLSAPASVGFALEAFGIDVENSLDTVRQFEYTTRWLGRAIYKQYNLRLDYGGNTNKSESS